MRAGAPYASVHSDDRAKFQSSPAHESGCAQTRVGDASNNNRFNPHPPMRAGAPAAVIRAVVGDGVSILTRP